MKKKINWKIVYFTALFIIVTIGAIFRLAYIHQTTTFFYDEATHTQMAWDFYRNGKIPYLGPAFRDFNGIKSYLPPFYYWLITPAVMVAGGDPLGIVIEIAIFGIAGIIAIYFFAKELFDKKAGLIAALFSSVNFVVILTERRIWNPNFLIFFTCLFCLFLWKSIMQKIKYLPLTFFLLSLMVSLHASAILFFPITFFLLIIFKRKIKYADTKQLLRISLFSLIAFTIPLVPWLAWEIKHHWLNSTNAWNSLFSAGAPQRLLVDSFRYSLEKFLSMTNTLLTQWAISSNTLNLFLILLLSVVIIFIILNKKRLQFIFCLLIVLFFIVGTTKFSYTIWDYFWTSIIPIMFVIIAGVFSELLNAKKIGFKILFAILIIIFFSFFYIPIHYKTYANFVRARLTRSTDKNFIAENTVLKDMIATLTWAKIDGGDEKYIIERKWKNFYPGFQDGNSYDYLAEWLNINFSDNPKFTYVILEPFNLPLDDNFFSQYKILDEKQFGYLKIYKTIKK